MAFLTKHKKLTGDIIVAALLLLVFGLNLFALTELRLQDRIYQKPSTPHYDIVVIGIDAEALDEFGKAEEWSRQLYADAINILNSSEEYKPAVIALDVLFVGERLDEKADKALIEAARAGGNVIAGASAIIGDVQSPLNPAKTIRAVIDFEKPFPALAQHAPYGAINGTFDLDGYIRSATLRFQGEGEVVYIDRSELTRPMVMVNRDIVDLREERTVTVAEVMD